MEQCFDHPKLVEYLRAKLNSGLSLIGIDGRPCSGKSTLADALSTGLGARCLCLDDFVVPVMDRPFCLAPAFPFRYIRYDEFSEAIRTLSSGKPFEYFPFDWEKGSVSKQSRVIEPSGIILVEGVTALNPVFTPNYVAKIYVVSDPVTEISTLAQREGGSLPREWTELYLPSVEIYFRKRPWRQADVLYGGRGISSSEKLTAVLSNL